MHFCYGTFVSFQGGAGAQHAPTFFCPATLHDSLFWEAQVGTWDTKLTKHLVSLQWGHLVPWQCRWPRNATRWTTLRCISWQSRRRGNSCLHNSIFTEEESATHPEIRERHRRDDRTCTKSELRWWTCLQFGVFPWLPPNACWEEIQHI